MTAPPAPRRPRAGLLAGALAFAVGCHYRVTLTSPTVGARLEGDDVEARLLPAELRLPWTPWRHRPVTVVAPGHRPVALDLGWRTLAHRGTGRRAEIEILLVPEHGGVGTWDADREGLLR